MEKAGISSGLFHSQTHYFFVMYVFFYSVGVCFYRFAVGFAALFNEKAALWVKGRRQVWKRMETVERGTGPLIWFHVASLGEFEQGRPVMEGLKEQSPGTKILLTFFSPSGYEIRKEYKGADFIFYLPTDSPGHARRLIKIFKPDAAVFVKYEYWYHYLHRLFNESIPVYLISALFRKEQPFFKWWGGLYRRMLGYFTELYVQDDESVQLLQSIGITRVRRVGDTRFDRVKQIADEARRIEKVELFSGDVPTVVCGSTWPVDEEFILEYINNQPAGLKWIIVPHEIGEAHIRDILSRCKRRVVRYSEDTQDTAMGEVMVVDRIGLLSSIYRYGAIAYVGGGFGVGIHNTLEAAVYGIPVIFGPHYHKFKEAVDLLECGSAFTIKTPSDFHALMDSLRENPVIVRQAGEGASAYVTSRLGATGEIVSQLLTHF